ncbi:heparinase II/III family protein [Aquabacterium humicola]|uniref:heparinase II/III family protein n=1 Tax=Aquabacterium humicola TaxID=3237377 RepID=UPI002543F03C|nr:heparinase II/III family protein [Rubrivivax pictus]
MTIDTPSDVLAAAGAPTAAARRSAPLSARRGLLIGTLLALAVLAVIWVPELVHWYVPSPRIDDAAIEAARRGPDDGRLDEIARMALVAARPDGDPRATMLRADQVLRGTAAFAGYAPTTIERPFAEADLVKGPPTWQLLLASLVATDTLLDAYALSRDERYFAQARDDLVRFADVEAARWLNSGFLWNDHAIAARIPVLVKFWRHYRGRADFDPAVARRVLALVQRSAVLLTRDSHYAFRTGHGIISDLAAMQVSLAFPMLDPERRFFAHGQRRFTQHLGYYISTEGVTLLHSAGYHGTGLEFFGMALRLTTLAGVPIRADWWPRYEKAVDLYGKLRRPDGTLPMFGDTRSVSEGHGPALTARGPREDAQPLQVRSDWAAPRPSFDLYPLSGHALWWDRAGAAGAQSQTAVTWSYFPGLGHKLADDLSLVTWSDGRPWITNVGYWPWGAWGRKQATSWPGSNAPHGAGEPAVSKRESRLLASLHGEQLSFVDLLRDGPGSFQVRRQILRLPGRDLWLVLDHTTGAPGATATHWTFAPDLVAGRVDERHYRLVDRATQRALTVAIAGPDSLRIELLRGSREPFGGWVVDDREPVAAPSLVVRQPSQPAWALAAFALGASESAAVLAARMQQWTDADHWTLALDGPAGPLQLRRDGGQLAIGDAAPLPLAAAAAPGAARQAVLSALAEAERSTPRFVERVHFRWRWTQWIAIAWFAQELLFLALRRWLPRAATPLRAASIAAWIAAGLWLGFVYFEGMWW